MGEAKRRRRRSSVGAPGDLAFSSKAVEVAVGDEQEKEKKKQEKKMLQRADADAGVAGGGWIPRRREEARTKLEYHKNCCAGRVHRCFGDDSIGKRPQGLYGTNAAPWLRRRGSEDLRFASRRSTCCVGRDRRRPWRCCVDTALVLRSGRLILNRVPADADPYRREAAASCCLNEKNGSLSTKPSLAARRRGQETEFHVSVWFS